VSGHENNAVPLHERESTFSVHGHYDLILGTARSTRSIRKPSPLVPLRTA
jgi:hypothetical protein